MKFPARLPLLQLRLWVTALCRPRELQVTLFYAGLVGFLGALAAHAFTQLSLGLQLLLTGQQGSLVHAAEQLTGWHRLVVPMGGGLAAGLVMLWGAPLLQGRRATDFMEAIVLRDGAIEPLPVLLRCQSALLSVASGGSMGREGPMVQLAAMLASWLGGLVRLPTPRRRLLVACGVAAGIASAYKAPIAGSLFVAEIIWARLPWPVLGRWYLPR